MDDRPFKFDEIGYWSEVKLDILREYASAYSTILAKQARLEHAYIDGFAGSGIHLSRETGAFVPGSPLNALAVRPPFRAYYLIDLDGDKVDQLRSFVENRGDVHVMQGDCNRILLEEVFPQVRYEDHRRALCVLDPYGLALDWQVIEAAGRSKAIDLFLNFPTHDMNRNALWRASDRLPASKAERLTRYWGDESWRKLAYRKEAGLFEELESKLDNEAVAEAFRLRLRDVAGFKHVPKPMPMRNSRGAIVYYLFFASQNPVGQKIASQIFDKYRGRGT